jgi:hypothetical protein
MTKPIIPALVAILLLGGVGMTWLSCSIEPPSVGDEDADTKFTHANFTEDNPCTTCHEEDRPTPEHGKGIECGVCHDPKDERPAVFTPKDGITSSGDTKTETNTQTATDTGTGTGSGLTSCVACHEKDRAPPPHVQQGDCVACHEPSNTGGGWKPK